MISPFKASFENMFLRLSKLLAFPGGLFCAFHYWTDISRNPSIFCRKFFLFLGMMDGKTIFFVVNHD